MSIIRIPPQKDTFITDTQPLGVRLTGSNVGLSEVLDVFKIAPLSGAVGVPATASHARSLLQFDLDPISDLISQKKIGDNREMHLVMRNMQHGQTLPYGFDLEVVPISSSVWDEGRGFDVDRFWDHGTANWEKPNQSASWILPGGDVDPSISPSTMHFEAGDEDLETDITEMTEAWLSGTLPNSGLMVRLTGAQEQDTSTYYLKRFHSRQSFFKNRRPYLEVAWDDLVKDVRGSFTFGATGSLYLYNTIDGQYVDLPGVGTGNDVLTVRIVDASGTIKTVSGSHTGMPGIYSASLAIPTGSSYSGSIFFDIWTSGSSTFFTGSFGPHASGPSGSAGQRAYVVNVENLKNEYTQDEVARLRMYVRPRDYNPPVVSTASFLVVNTIVKKGYYSIIDDRTKEQILSFRTGSVPSTQLSYDSDGNFFDLYMQSFPTGNVYRLSFLFDLDGQRQIIDGGLKFKVV